MALSGKDATDQLEIYHHIVLVLYFDIFAMYCEFISALVIVRVSRSDGQLTTRVSGVANEQSLHVTPTPPTFLPPLFINFLF
jgi:hypothetical protein